ncbi:unnamed protein product [Paramecium sonneborni]|uniref:Uncharacterized protein n=1 Tax=Paramecium sonneborni TaxID=65129 RepID=A0A8S1P8W8_9CILI|nr:unnamed protein product [Paramecium sonneborni]
MIIILFLLTNISEQKNQPCNTFIYKDECEKQSICKWENEDCKIKQINNNYCNSYNNPLKEELCIQDTQCAFYNNKCEHFFGCGAYQNYGSNCPRISINCISVTDEIVCMQKPFNCLQISEMKYCGQMDHQQGSKESCEWKDDKCQFVGCEKINNLGYLSQSKCQSFHSICKFDGIECKIRLLECSSYLKDCNQIIAYTGKCQFNTTNQQCMNASCYNYFEDSYEKCQKHFGQFGSQCVYNRDKFEGLCLEIDYQTQIGKCIKEMKNKSCDQFLKISECFGISTYKYDNTIKFCLDDYNLERRDCKINLNQYDCNLSETIELKKCQWIQNSCQTINSCFDYVLRIDSTEDACSNLNLNCKQISCSKNKHGCCVTIQGCSGYFLQEECTNNSNIVLNLLDACIWENNSCRYKKCEDYSNDDYQCNNLAECIFIGNKCQTRNKLICEDLKNEDDCRFKNCFWLSSNCYDVRNLTTYLPNLAKILGDEDTVCQIFSDKLMYSSLTKTCRLKTACKNYSSFCQEMRQYDDTQCVNVNSQCIPMTFCSQLQSSDYKICYKALNFCNSNGQVCETAEQQCSAYNEEKKCNFQLDGSLCSWISVKQKKYCIVKQCENLDLQKQECDSKRLCVDPKLCRQNMCFEYNNQCFTKKSRCSDYRDFQCYKSISNLCFWNGVSCMDLMTCKILTQKQCEDQKYINTCKFNEFSMQCEELDCPNSQTYYISLDLRSVTCQNCIKTETNSCQQNNNQDGYSNFCSSKEV